MRERLAHQGLLDDLEAFHEHLRGFALGHVEAFEFGRLVAASDTEQQTPAAQRVDHGRVFRHPQRVLQRKDDNRGADLHRFRALRHRGREQQGVAQHAVDGEMVFRQPDGFETERFSMLDLLHHFREEFILGYVSEIAEQIK